MTDLLGAAIGYVDQGWPVVPLNMTESKKPWDFAAGRGLRGWPALASVEDKAVFDWFTADRPGLGVGIVTGATSGIVVLDVDPRGGGEEGFAALIEDFGPLPNTRSALSGRGDGGRHLYFAHPGGVVAAWSAEQKARYQGIDVKADKKDGGVGHFVVAPPSPHPATGEPYRWADESVPLAVLPAALAAALRPTVAPATATPAAPGAPTVRDQAWAQAVLERVCGDFTGLTAERNNHLNSAAVRCFRLALGGLLDVAQVRARLAAAANAVGTPGVEATLDSAWRKAQADGPTLGPDGAEGIWADAALPDVTIPDRGVVGLGSWTALDLTDFLAGDYDPEEPSVGHIGRPDGLALFYPGRKHVVVAESEAGKTWLMLHAAHQEIAAGNHVVFYDFEDAMEGVVGRLRVIGADPAVIATHFHYVAPNEPLTAETTALLTAELVALAPTLVIVDGVTEAMTMHDWEINSNKEVALFYRQVLNPLAASGAAVVALDHLPKADEKKRGSIGGVHKLNGIDGAVYRLDNKAQIIIGRRGKSLLTIDKDRPGQVKKHQEAGKRIAELHVWSDNGDGTVTVTLEAPGAVAGPDDGDLHGGPAVRAPRGGEQMVTAVLRTDSAIGTTELCEQVRAAYGDKAPSVSTIKRALKEMHDVDLVVRTEVQDGPVKRYSWRLR